MKKELSGGCGIAILGFALLMILFGIIAVFDMRAEGQAAMAPSGC